MKRKKHCPRCNLLKPASDFHRRSASKDGLTARCSECINELNRMRYEQDDELRAKKTVQATNRYYQLKEVAHG